MSTQRLIKDIQAGRLTITLTENGHRLDELIAFASRLNPRRGYLFVSRVLGKHIPVRPQRWTVFTPNWPWLSTYVATPLMSSAWPKRLWA